MIVFGLELSTDASYQLSMVGLYISRRLKIGDERFSESEVLERGPVIVVLAEPGAGKTDLLGNSAASLEWPLSGRAYFAIGPNPPSGRL